MRSSPVDPFLRKRARRGALAPGGSVKVRLRGGWGRVFRFKEMRGRPRIMRCFFRVKSVWNFWRFVEKNLIFVLSK